jgi:hypothetical protein
MSRLLAPIPRQLTTLRLEKIIFTPESLRGSQRQFLPFLSSLTLVDIVFLGPMRQYFHFPKLNSLCYSIVTSNLAWDTTMEGIKNPFWSSIQETFDTAFFQENLALEKISFEGIQLDEAVVTILASCPALHTLEIKESGIDGFICPFLERLSDEEYLPSLQMLGINCSWSPLYSLSYGEFMTECRSTRPRVVIFGDGGLSYKKETQRVFW